MLQIEKIKEFRENNFLYFEENSPKINDAEFDKLKKINRCLINQLKEYYYLINLFITFNMKSYINVCILCKNTCNYVSLHRQQSL